MALVLPLITYVNAGYNAYRMAYSNGHFGFDARPEEIQNPYRTAPYAELWEKGWTVARIELGSRTELQSGGYLSHFRYNPFTRNSAVRKLVKGKTNLLERSSKPSTQLSTQPQRHPQKQKPQQSAHQKQNPPRKPFKGGFTPKPKSFVPAAPISLKRIERFNNKHRTVA